MDSASNQPLPLEELVSRFRRQNNREPRGSHELQVFSKKITGVDLNHYDAQAYFKSRSPTGARSKTRPTPRSPTSKSSEKFQVGDEIMLMNDRGTATIRYVGVIGSGVKYGIEMHGGRAGDCDGTYRKNQIRYFVCDPGRGMFVREGQIRKKVEQRDRQREERRMAGRNSRPTGSISSDAETQSREASVEEEKSHGGANGRRMVSPKASRIPRTHQQQSPRNGHAFEQQSAESGIVQIDDLDYYPAKSDDNLLQFAANQADLTLRSDLLDLYVNPTISPHFRVVFEDLKQFSPRAQHDLLLGDLLPRMKAFLSS